MECLLGSDFHACREKVTKWPEGAVSSGASPSSGAESFPAHAPPPLPEGRERARILTPPACGQLWAAF